jgi:UDP-GlcNAc:undecaprenyl-phosphate GlcNAc-1-phosphate transferase
MYTKQIVSLSLMVILVLCIALAVMHQGAAQSVGDAYTHGHAISHLNSTVALDDLDRMPATSAGPGSTRNDATGNTSQPRKISAPQPVSGEQIKYSLLVLLSAALIAWLSGYLIVRYEHLHAHLSHDHTDSGPQKYHAQPTPRIGGIALALGLLAAGGVMLVSNNQLPLTGYGLLLIAAIPAFAGGIVEDLTKKVGVLERLILTMLSAAAAAWLLDAILTQIEIPLLREALTWMPFAVAFTVFAVGGVANAINIIDGYNGLAPGYALITLAAIAWVAALVGDSLILIAALAMAGAVLGFFVWNWPKGKIFMGDAGAYLLGFWLAELCVLLVVRNPDHVYARFCLALMIYPVFETIFSIYRRKLLQKQSPGQPDNMHFHQLVYKHQNLNRPASQDPLELTRRNSAVAPRFWLITGLFALASLFFWDRPGGLVAVTLTFCMAYVWGYFHLLSKTKDCA